jgi:ribosomal protein L29
MKMNDIRGLQDFALKAKLDDLNLELGAERRKVASTGVASKVVKIRDIKRTIARIQTVMRQRGATK